MNLGTPLVPRGTDKVLRVIIPGRISTPGQDMASITSQHEDAERWLQRVYAGPTEIRRLGEQASGWVVDRQTMVEADELVTSGDWDLVLVTELREIYRNPRMQWGFVQACLDADVRFVSLADNIDTADVNWEVMMHTASLRHGMTVPEARQRVRRKATSSFAHGGMVLKIKYGYRKLTREEAAGGTFGPVGLRIAKRPDCTATIRQMAAWVVAGWSYVRVADRLNQDGVSPGAYVDREQWTGRTVKDLLRDPILSGRRRFRTTITKMVYGTGKHRSCPNPAPPEEKEYPELGHLTPDEHAAVLEVVEARRTASAKRQRAGKENPLWRQPRKRTRWPGQSATCGCCGGRMYQYGTLLRCQNTLAGSTRSCWNHVQVDIATVRAVVIPWVMSIIGDQAGFRETLAAAAWAEFGRHRRRRQKSGNTLDGQIADLEVRAKRLATAIGLGGELEALVTELKEVQDALQAARGERSRVAEEHDAAGEFTSAADVAARLDEAIERMAETSAEFAEILRRLLPVFVIRPVQQLDRPAIRPRATITLRFDAWAAPGEPPFEASTTLDLFQPPVHVRHLPACLAAKAARPDASLNEIAAELDINRMTVKRAYAYARLMAAEGLTDPYRELKVRPAVASRWDRKRKPKEEPPAD
ncbi:recombinase family protein [Fimbriiglobus ruber]|uniref:Site-specific recombinase n=1 Tax=Fimbriiglobus ruber TaxID=1908690 RepID=A0A225CY17_9BACT|nr:recombinase family protein [Fimbriiglobus ruber]OWK34231.1 Site-specific recombinase [Fimbriiglobus ruber]